MRFGCTRVYSIIHHHYPPFLHHFTITLPRSMVNHHDQGHQPIADYPPTYHLPWPPMLNLAPMWRMSLLSPLTLALLWHILLVRQGENSLGAKEEENAMVREKEDEPTFRWQTVR